MPKGELHYGLVIQFLTRDFTVTLSILENVTDKVVPVHAKKKKGI
jgi:hypothetical protein